MDYKQIGDKIIANEIYDFSIAETMESGQCFRFEKITDSHYVLIAHGRKLNVLQEGSRFTFYPCTPEDFDAIWINYFDLDRDYAEIKKKLADSDEVMREAVSYADGIRILNQEFWECLVCFIISQRSNINKIKLNTAMLCEAFGTNANGYYTFPTAKQLQNASVEDLAACRVGYRAKYIADAVHKVNSGLIAYDGYRGLDAEQIKKNLLTINGVGEKVANCVMLFSCGVKDMFPVDVWVRRIMRDCYFGGQEAAEEDIQSLAFKKFGRYAGFAQQFLFHLARTSTYIKGEKSC